MSITIKSVAGCAPPRFVLADDKAAFPEGGLDAEALRALHAAIGAIIGTGAADDLLTVKQAVALAGKLDKPASLPNVRRAARLGKIAGVKRTSIKTGRGQALLMPRSTFLAWLDSDRRYRGGSRRKMPTATAHS